MLQKAVEGDERAGEGEGDEEERRGLRAEERRNSRV